LNPSTFRRISRLPRVEAVGSPTVVRVPSDVGLGVNDHPGVPDHVPRHRSLCCLRLPWLRERLGRAFSLIDGLFQELMFWTGLGRLWRVRLGCR
jgi:hypothetical protein